MRGKSNGLSYDRELQIRRNANKKAIVRGYVGSRTVTPSLTKQYHHTTCVRYIQTQISTFLFITYEGIIVGELYGVSTFTKRK